MFTTVQFEIKPFETAYDGTVDNLSCRKKVGKNKDFIIPCKSGTQIEVILDKTIESRYQFYSDLLKRERGLKVNEKIKCVFKKYMVELNQYDYRTSTLGDERTSYTFVNESDILKTLKRSSHAFAGMVMKTILTVVVMLLMLSNRLQLMRHRTNH